MYAFLSQPPPSKKTTRRVPAPLSPSRNAISAWASTVYPGSPAPCSPSSLPCSPATRRRASVGRRPSLTLSHRRRPSIGQRTPSTAEYRPDLTAFGYTSLFVQFDKTPTTPSPFQQKNSNVNAATPLTSDVFGSIPIPPVPQVRTPTSVSARKPGPTRRFRPFSILRSKKSKFNEVPPTSPIKSHKSKGKKSTKPKPGAPPSLANELALMQFMGGGSVEDNVKKVMQARSKAVTKSASGQRAVEDVYRDEKGGIWYDKDEEMEYVHLLSFGDDDKGDWEDEELNEGTSPGLGSGIVVKASSPYTNAYCPLDVVTIQRTPTSSSLPPRSRPLLTLPSRPRQSHRASYAHLANPPSFILDFNLDAIEAFLPRSPRTPKSPKSPHPPSPSVSFVVPPAQSLGTRKQKHRPRPAPLKLTSAQSAHARANAKVAMKNLSTPGAAREGVKEVNPASWSLEKARREFVEDSFKPLPVVVPGQGALRKVSRVDVRGVFG